MSFLPKQIGHVRVPPIKCQGIKTKLVRFIAANIQLEGNGRWIEPFVGSGVVALNVAPERALLSDTNRHIIGLYSAIQLGTITGELARDFLQAEGGKLQEDGAYYYEVRERFNRNGAPLDFLFLNRSCFNGIMRFNGKGGFNVPFCKKPARFAPAYITKIVNQIVCVKKQIRDKDWEFKVADWRTTLAEASQEDFVYVDPPYIGRHTDYFNAWRDQEAADLSQFAEDLPCGYALSMWLENRHRHNDHIDEYWKNVDVRTIEHFYHVGPSEELRNAMEEALAIRKGWAAAVSAEQPVQKETLGSRRQGPLGFLLR